MRPCHLPASPISIAMQRNKVGGGRTTLCERLHQTDIRLPVTSTAHASSMLGPSLAHSRIRSMRTQQRLSCGLARPVADSAEPAEYFVSAQAPDLRSATRWGLDLPDARSLTQHCNGQESDPAPAPSATCLNFSRVVMGSWRTSAHSARSRRIAVAWPKVSV